MSLKASNKVDVNRYELEIEVSAEEFKAAIQKAYLKQKNKINIPGFRRGKAPQSFIEKYYGEQVFFEEAINLIYPDALDNAIEEASLEVINDKMDFDLGDVSKENGFTFKVKLTVKPEVEINNYKGIEIKPQSSEVTEEDINNEIKQTQERNSRMITVEDRPAENGDIVVIDFEGFVDGVAFEGGKAENHSLTLGSGQFIPGFEDQIIGHNTDDEFDVNVTFPEEYQVKELAGKPAVFKVKIYEIKHKELPLVDDDFVKDVSEFDTLDQYKDDIKSKIAERKEQEVKADIDTQITDKLAEIIEATIPEVMFENQIDENVKDFEYRLKSQGMELDMYLTYCGMDMNRFRDEFRANAEKRVKIQLALEKIAQIENVEPIEQEVADKYEEIAKQYHMPVDKIKEFIHEDDIKKDVVLSKALDIVRDNAIIV